MNPVLLPSAVKVRIFAPNDSDPNKCVQHWTVPGWVLPIPSPSVRWSIEDYRHPTVIHKRIADKMGIVDGFNVEIEFVENGVRCMIPVNVRDGLSAPILINGFLDTGYLKTVTCDNTGNKMIFKNGKVVNTTMQSFWYGLRVVFPAKHVVILTFDGCSKKNPKGPSGYGFVVHRGTNDTDECSMGDLLLQGYGYSPSGGSSNRMEYAGLVEGLHWAKLVHTTKIIVRGDSNLVINQITGKYQVKNPVLQRYRKEVLQLVKDANKSGKEVVFQHIRRENNQIADTLANMGTSLKENAVAVNWENCNRLYLGS